MAFGEYEYHNHLYGGQIGADLALLNPGGRLQFDVIGKAGVYGNAANGGVSLHQGAVAVGQYGTGDTDEAFVGELGLTASFLLTDHIALRAAYQFLSLSDLALASNNASVSQLNPSLLNQRIESRSLLYDGATVGIEFAW